MGEEMNSFSERLKMLRTKEKLTQKQLAEKLGISSGSVIAYEKTTKVPSIDVCVKIATFFNVSMDWLCGLTDDVKNYEIRTYADAFRMIVALHEWIGVSCIPPESGEYTAEHNWAIWFEDDELSDTIGAWVKIKSLYDSGTIDEEIYNLWVEKRLSVLAKKGVVSYLFSSGKIRTEEFPWEMDEPEIENPDEIFDGGDIHADNTEEE